MPLISIIIAALIALGGGTAAWADNAKPGDWLYPVDQWVEKVQERVTWAQEAKASLLARFSEERVEELQALLDVDIEQLQGQARERWEQHRAQALDRVAASAERINVVIERFQDKLANAENEGQKAIFEKVIGRIQEIMARRELHLDEMESKEFPGIGQVPVRQMMRTWAREHSGEIDAMREQMMETFGDSMPGRGVRGLGPLTGADEDGEAGVEPAIAEDPFPPRFDVPVPSPKEIARTHQQWQEIQDQLREEAARWLGQDTEDDESDEFEIIDPPVPQLELMDTI